MSSAKVGIEEARKRLGDLVTAAQQGADTIITRNGRPVARLTSYQEPTMSQIPIRAREADNPFEVDTNRDPQYNGSFDTATSRYWCGNGKPRKVVTDAEDPESYVLEGRENERLWRTADGRWVTTNGPHVYQVSDAEAEQWFTDNGFTAEDRDAFSRSGQ